MSFMNMETNVHGEAHARATCDRAHLEMADSVQNGMDSPVLKFHCELGEEKNTLLLLEALQRKRGDFS